MTSRMNTPKTISVRILALLAQRFTTCFRKRANRPRNMEIQMEFPWLSKR